MKLVTAKVTVDKLFKDVKFLTKCKDLAQGNKFEPVPTDLADHWVTLMWLRGIITALSSAGYEIVEKKK